ncbi:c-type cytochrome biogenesis protein CcmI [Thalassotalea maritima]|uniref:c-type cytochrome biogenesis protein CcmI n=1 Tax=Thalassotalea maritima TaxID=3242416 RepID=UPI003527D4DC
MTLFYVFSALLLVLAVLFIWRHFFTQSLYQADQSNMRGQTNKELYYEHLAELEKDLQEGGIDKESFDYLKQELDRSLVLDMSASEKQAQIKDKLTSKIWPLMMSVFVLAFSFAMYWQYGAHDDVKLAQTMPSEHPRGEQSQAQIIIAQLQNLQKEVETNPDNSNAWFQLGQILSNIGQFDSAYVAFGKVNEIEGDQADVLALQAQTIYYKNNQQRNEQVDALLARALSIDPNDATTLMLIGMDHYLNNRFAQAATSWQQIIDAGTAGPNAMALIEAINDAKAKASDADIPVDEVKPTIAGASLQVSVTLADNIIERLQQEDDKVVFIYAVASAGPRMPLAAMKIRASDLPTSITLDDSLAMTPQMALSSAEQVNVYAVVSQSGTPGQKPGDYVGQATQITLSEQDSVNLIIDTVVE